MTASRLFPGLADRRSRSVGTVSQTNTIEDAESAELLSRALFIKLLCLERKRAERSGRGFVLMVLDARDLLRQRDPHGSVEKIQHVLSRCTRDTDIKGWYTERAVIGVIFTETPLGDTSIPQLFSRKVTEALRESLNEEQIGQIAMSVHVFPEPVDSDDSGPGSMSAVYPDVMVELQSKRVPLLVKRCLDIAGSALALVILMPLLLLLALAVRFTSSGPALFRQKRVGQNGKSFTFLKFRSMHMAADHAIHEAYIKSFIADKTDAADGCTNGAEAKVYKLKADPRITRIGRFLRRTSLDELPQLLNVLTGQMSLVGPRPPVPYEFASYNTWHRRRLLAVKPGITGFWQVEGRSRVKFDDMVRMDLEYARDWSIGLDIKILLQTPRAVLSGDGAY